MPAPKDAAKVRAAKIRKDAAQALPARLAKRLQELADEGKVARHPKTREPMQSRAAELLGLDQPELSEILRGIRMPGADKLAVMCVVLGVSADDMLGLQLSDEERATRLVRDLFHPVLRRLVYEQLKLEFDGTPKELEEAVIESMPRLPPQEVSTEPNRNTDDTGAVHATKKQKRPRSTR